MIVNALSYLSILALMLGCNTSRKVTHTLTKDTVQDKKTSAQAEQQTNIPPIIGNKGLNSPDATGLKKKQEVPLKQSPSIITQTKFDKPNVAANVKNDKESPPPDTTDLQTQQATLPKKEQNQVSQETPLKNGIEKQKDIAKKQTKLQEGKVSNRVLSSVKVLL